MATAKSKTRAGSTAKISVSLSTSDLAALRRRARVRHGGNLSAAIAEGVRRVREEEGREQLVKWLGDAARVTSAEREALIAEWTASPPRARRRGVA